MRPLEAYESLMSFAAERGEEAFHLALHASVPQSFRPDFLHLLRLNFLPGLPPAAEADVLLAPFCEDTGGGYYQFDPEVRRLLLSHLDPTFPEEKGERLRRVASLLVSYIGHQGRSLSAEQDRLSEEYLSIQTWVALAFLYPEQAAMQLAAALELGLGDGETAARVQFSGLAAALSVPLVHYPKLLTYAAGLEALEQGRLADAADLLERLPDEEIQVGGVTLRSPRRVMREREAGAPELESSPAAPVMPYRSCFISYRTGEEPFVEQLRQSLLGYGVTFWSAPQVDSSEAVASSTVQEAISRQDVFLVTLTKGATGASDGGYETGYAQGAGKPILGLMIEPVEGPSWPEYSFIDFTRWRAPQAYDLALDSLLSALTDQKWLDLLRDRSVEITPSPSPGRKSDFAWKNLEQAGFLYHCYISSLDSAASLPRSEMLVNELKVSLRSYFKNPKVFFDQLPTPGVAALCCSATMLALCKPLYLEPQSRGGREWMAMERLQREWLPDRSQRLILPVILQRSRALPRVVREARPLDLSNFFRKNEYSAIRSAVREIAETIAQAVEALSRQRAKAGPWMSRLPTQSAFDESSRDKKERVFISYARADGTEYASMVSKAFARAGLSVWSDQKLLPSSELVQNIKREIEECSIFIVIVSRAAVSSRRVHEELETALTSVSQPLIIPVVIDGTDPGEFRQLAGLVAFVLHDKWDLDELVDQALAGARFRR